MRLSIIILSLLVLLPFNASAMDASVSEGSHPLPVGSTMPDLTLQGELSSQCENELGLKDADRHSLSEIKAEIVILVAFSMYCPHCQREAPTLNELHELIAKRGLDRDVKLIGVGVGNSDFEVNVFREKYAINFPLFSDPEFKTNKDLGEVGTPFFYVLDMREAKKGIKVADTKLGRMSSAADFLDEALKAGALEK